MRALQTVASSPSKVAWRGRSDDAETTSIMQGLVSRVVVKDFSDANLLKQTEGVGFLIHAISLVNLRIVPFSNAARDLDRPDSSPQGGFMVGSHTLELYKQGIAVTPHISWSPHKVRRSAYALLDGEVSMMSGGLADSKWILGVSETAVYQDYEIPLHRRIMITLSVEPKVTAMTTDNCRPNRPQGAPSMRNVLLSILVRESTGGYCRRTVQELWVIRRSMQTLKGRSRWVPHERMVIDALTKRHRNSITMLRPL